MWALRFSYSCPLTFSSFARLAGSNSCPKIYLPEDCRHPKPALSHRASSRLSFHRASSASLHRLQVRKHLPDNTAATPYKKGMPCRNSVCLCSKRPVPAQAAELPQWLFQRLSNRTSPSVPHPHRQPDGTDSRHNRPYLPTRHQPPSATILLPIVPKASSDTAGVRRKEKSRFSF